MSVFYNRLNLFTNTFLECLVELNRDIQTLAGGIVLVDIGPTYSQPAQNHLSVDIACKYVNLKLVKGEGRGTGFENKFIDGLSGNDMHILIFLFKLMAVIFGVWKRVMKHFHT